MLGRVVQVNKHPFTIIGVAPPDFRGTLVFYSPNFFLPLVDKEQVEGATDLNDRGSRGLMQVMGRLKPGVTPARAIADLNSIGSWLERAYQKTNARRASRWEGQAFSAIRQQAPFRHSLPD